MKSTYSLIQQYTSCVLLVSLLLQSCDGFSNLPLPNSDEKANSIQPIDKIDYQPILNQKLIAAGGHTVTVYQEADGTIKASVEIAGEKNKVYNCVPVAVERGTNIKAFPQLPKKVQQGHIQIQFNKKGQPIGAALRKPGLMGGGNIIAKLRENLDEGCCEDEKIEEQIEEEIKYKQEEQIKELVVPNSSSASATSSMLINKENITTRSLDIHPCTSIQSISLRNPSIKGKEKDGEEETSEEAEQDKRKEGAVSVVLRQNQIEGRRSSIKGKEKDGVEETAEEEAEQDKRKEEELEGIHISKQLAIWEVKENTNHLKKRNPFLVLGSAGVGKSTIINYLLGNRLCRGLYEGEDVIKPVNTSANSIKCYPQIGHGVKPQTLLSSVYIDDSSPFAYCDCPGSKGNSVKLRRFQEIVGLKYRLERVEEIKGILAILDVADIFKSRPVETIEFCRILGYMLDTNLFGQSILFVFNNKNGKDRDLTEVRKRILDITTDEEEKMVDLNSQIGNETESMEIQEISEGISVLKAIYNNLHNNHPIRLLDDFTSKATIESLLQDFTPIPKDSFKFLNYHKEPDQFAKQLYSSIRGLLIGVKKYTGFFNLFEPNSRYHIRLASYEQELAFLIDLYKNCIREILDNRPTFALLNQIDTQVDDMKTALAECIAKLDELRKVMPRGSDTPPADESNLPYSPPFKLQHSTALEDMSEQIKEAKRL